jgi:hypothetical protein
MKYPSKRILRLTLWLGILAAALPYFLLSFLAAPHADDYFFAAWFREKGLAGYMAAHMECCNGRYSGVFLTGLNPLSFGRHDLYFLMPLLTLILLASSLIFLGRQALSREARRMATLISAGTFIIILNGLPGLAEGIYWANASVIHFWANIMLLTLLALLLWRPEGQTTKGLRIALALIICLIIPGMNELSLSMLLGILILRLVLLYRADKKYEMRLSLGLLLAGLAGTAVMLLMPGTRARSEALPGFLDPAFAFEGAFELSVYLIGQQLQQPAFIIWSLILLGLFAGMARLPLFSFVESIRHKWLIPLTSVTIIYLLYFVALLLLGSWPPWRVHNTAAIAFHALAILNIAVLSTWRRQEIQVLAGNRIMQVLPFIMLWFLFTDFTWQDPRDEPTLRNNTVNAWHDLSGDASGFKSIDIWRHRICLEGGASDTLSLPALPSSCRSLYSGDISEDPGALPNALMAYYYEVSAVVLLKKTETPLP